MPLNPAQRHQIEQDAITAAWEAERRAACDDAIGPLREIADLETDATAMSFLGPTRTATMICCRALPPCNHRGKFDPLTFVIIARCDRLSYLIQ